MVWCGYIIKQKNQNCVLCIATDYSSSRLLMPRDSRVLAFCMMCASRAFLKESRSLLSQFSIGICNIKQPFSFECRKTKTKAITLTNHNTRKQRNEPIRIRSKCMQPAPSVRPSHDWFWFSFSLVEKVARVLLTNHRAQQSKTKAITKLLSTLN